MSLPVRNNSAANIRPEGRENQPRAKGQRAANNRRPVLGNVTNQVRRQPQRSAKDKHSVVQPGSSRVCEGQENAGPSNVQKKGNAGPASFAIFEDAAPSEARVPAAGCEAHDDSMQDQENMIPEQDLVLHDAVVGLNRNERHHIPLAPIPLVEVEPVAAVSPMVVDHVREREVSTNRPDEFGLDPYFTDIYNYLRSIEIASRPGQDYMNRQTDVTPSMRNILVDWLVEVGEEYRLHRETLFLAVSYIDRFLGLVGVHRPKLQLVGAASMFIAAKYEEIYPPDVSEFVYITDDTYSKHQVLKMESVILKLLNFKIAVPTINWFSERFMDLIQMSEKSKNLAFFLTELSLIEVEDFLEFRPSVIAASAILLSRTILAEASPWPQQLEETSGYTYSDLKICTSCLFNLFSRKSSLAQQAVVEKYKQEKFLGVALIEPPRFMSLY